MIRMISGRHHRVSSNDLRPILTIDDLVFGAYHLHLANHLPYRFLQFFRDIRRPAYLQPVALFIRRALWFST